MTQNHRVTSHQRGGEGKNESQRAEKKSMAEEKLEVGGEVLVNRRDALEGGSPGKGKRVA